jgi:hypothetical protein
MTLEFGRKYPSTLNKEKEAIGRVVLIGLIIPGEMMSRL